MDLKGKCVLLGVSGGIAAYKMANVASALRKLGADKDADRKPQTRRQHRSDKKSAYRCV